ncbi:SDR family oxidoreductase [Clostridium beijerinckii]|jgi:Dehydrogenases with different specificities (related to short-chain alcohol dehydrogenases)|uniref:SDR family oxidoreductase n=2 Tax=Clostridium beijerinckii TaxID=1520 RepID=A0AAE2RS61_CLOBE|nr:SDR family oxidoreductase [Clostridium beijerinckii]ABR36018.1 short-chain dehydrogenase/reductase SDR [Clostridium beijerinckii NCIMB 8052]AIU02854.1 short-chain dehydrogenase/reductase SDR [Clostridium beijerinckii ATCC 35702]MBF7809341.1 SDR family oxidoreductase [Clostridium beijerinckii]NRT22936.1 3-oxoacyl-[acyl-carrier protein] reductase [Clostridium beijerinckii]NRT69904.1 3-oxoacyl-[acyl-carrier protein] reductase [Clostridium beijerinckii]
MRNLEGKVAIITGASRGIGSAIARQLSALGAKVVVNYSNNAVKAEEVVEEITKSGEQAVAIKADVSNIKDVEKLFSETITKFGRVDILINNAGVILYKLLSDVTEEEFDKLFNINVKGTYFACQQAMKHMENNGRIINFSTSVVGSMFPTYSVYAATKGAVEQITRQLAKEFGPKKITINAVAPGPINTELFNVGKTDEQIEAIRQMNSFGRIGEPDDIANTIEFLVSDKAQWITGQTLRINGGYV